MICPDERPISHSFLPCILKYECEAEDKKRGALSSLFRQCLHFCSLRKLLVRSVPRSSRDTSLAKDNYRHHHHPRSNYSKRHGCFLSILTPLFKWLTCSFINLPIEHTQGLPLPSHHSSVTFLLREQVSYQLFKAMNIYQKLISLQLRDRNKHQEYNTDCPAFSPT